MVADTGIRWLIVAPCAKSALVTLEAHPAVLRELLDAEGRKFDMSIAQLNRTRGSEAEWRAFKAEVIAVKELFGDRQLRTRDK